MMEQNSKRICKKCLLEDFAPDEYLESMRVYLQSLDEEVKVNEEVYRERLSRCEECDKLNEDICKICGCFVEYRAAIKMRYCPDHHPRW